MWKISDGITQSMIQTWLTCPEKARLRYVKGLVREGPLGVPLEFGSLVHTVLEKCYAGGTRSFGPLLEEIHQEWASRVRTADDLQTVEDNIVIAGIVLKLYFKHWEEQDAGIDWMHTEKVFCVSFKICRTQGPDGIHTQKVFCRGKFDGVFRSNGGVWLLETKTKGQVRENILMDTLTFDFQTMFYLSALAECIGEFPKGILYNIIRRPQISQKKSETKDEFIARLVCDIDDRPDFYYHRYEIAVFPSELTIWQSELNLILRSMRMWEKGHTYHNTTNCDKYSGCEYLPICARNDTAGFTTLSNPFPELEEGELVWEK